MSSQEKYADIINKLLRKAESTTPEEAELLMAKAQELMEKYRIDEAMIAAARGTESEDPIVTHEFVITGIWRYPLSELCHYTLMFNSVKAAYIVRKGRLDGPPRRVDGKLYKQTVVLQAVGFKSDIERCRMLFTSLEIQAMRAENAWWRSIGSPLHQYKKPGEQHIERRGFLFGFAEGAGVKMRDATKRGRVAAEEQHGSHSVALVLQSREMKLQNEYDRLMGEVESVGKDRANRGGNHAQNSGFAAGQTADVGQEQLQR